jgi:hypothetical protein
MGLEPKQARQPKAPAKYGAFGDARAVEDRYLFGTDAEIENRVATGYPTNPAGAAPRFRQIRPGPTSQSANDPRPKSYGGDSKIGSPRKYA